MAWHEHKRGGRVMCTNEEGGRVMCTNEEEGRGRRKAGERKERGGGPRGMAGGMRGGMGGGMGGGTRAKRNGMEGGMGGSEEDLVRWFLMIFRTPLRKVNKHHNARQHYIMHTLFLTMVSYMSRSMDETRRMNLYAIRKFLTIALDGLSKGLRVMYSDMCTGRSVDDAFAFMRHWIIADMDLMCAHSTSTRTQHYQILQKIYNDVCGDNYPAVRSFLAHSAFKQCFQSEIDISFGMNQERPEAEVG